MSPIVYDDYQQPSDALDDLRHTEKQRWRQALTFLAQNHDHQTILALINVLNEAQDWSVQIEVAKVLGKIGDSEAVPGLIEALTGKDEWLSAAAAQALGTIADSRAVPSLVDTLIAKKDLQLIATARSSPKDSNEVIAILQYMQDIFNLRASAAEALGRIANDEALEGLAQVLYEDDSESKGIKAIATNILKQVNTPKAQHLLNQWEQRTTRAG